MNDCPTDAGTTRAGTMCNGLAMSSIGKLLTEKLDVLRLTFYTAPLTLFVLVPFYKQLEAPAFANYSTQGSAYLGECRMLQQVCEAVGAPLCRSRTQVAVAVEMSQIGVASDVHKPYGT